MALYSCPSRLATRDENGSRYWPKCDRPEGHVGGHMHGHYADVSWHWSDDEAMTEDEMAAWDRGLR